MHGKYDLIGKQFQKTDTSVFIDHRLSWAARVLENLLKEHRRTRPHKDRIKNESLQVTVGMSNEVSVALNKLRNIRNTPLMLFTNYM